MYSIYLVTNKTNGKKYVGQTKGKVWKRWSAHKNAAFSRRQKHIFSCAIRKYGREGFDVTTIDEVETVQEANIVEENWIRVLKTTDIAFGYNMKTSAQGKELTKEVREKISRAHKQRYIDHPELREQSSKINKGKKFSEETKHLMSLAKIGVSRLPYTDETRRLMSEAQKAAWEGRERDLPERPVEVKEQISEGLRKYHASLTPEEKALRSQKAREKTLAYNAKKKLELLTNVA